jgi:hypothetical protein
MLEQCSSLHKQPDLSLAASFNVQLFLNCVLGAYSDSPFTCYVKESYRDSHLLTDLVPAGGSIFCSRILRWPTTRVPSYSISSSKISNVSLLLPINPLLLLLLLQKCATRHTARSPRNWVWSANTPWHFRTHHQNPLA